jgi:hypothetical protein
MTLVRADNNPSSTRLSESVSLEANRFSTYNTDILSNIAELKLNHVYRTAT